MQTVSEASTINWKCTIADSGKPCMSDARMMTTGDSDGFNW